MSATSLRVRSAQPGDVWRLRRFLRDVTLADGEHPRAWSVARFDYCRLHVLPNVAGLTLADVARVWQVGAEIVGLVLADGPPGEANLSLAPTYRGADVLGIVLEDAESELNAVDAEGRRTLAVWAHESDDACTALLHERGYEQLDVRESVYRCELDPETRAPPPPAPYEVRALGDGLEVLERCYASGLAFHDGDLRTASENRADPSWYRRLQRAPLYRRDLDLVAVHRDGAIAGFVTAWFDDVTREALLEPVGVVPAHRGRGVARALLHSALERSAEVGATRAVVGGYDGATASLYGSVLGPARAAIGAWRRRW